MSGEQLAGKLESGIDTEFATWLASELKPVITKGTEVVIMVGGGNFVRGATVSGGGIKRVTGDHMGMLATMINALALTDIFEAEGLPTRCLSNIFAIQVAEPFVFRLANKHLGAGRIVIVAGGVGRPYITTDTAAVELALELDCDVVLKATKVDGVYTKDPTKHSDAKKIDNLSYEQAVEDDGIKIMDTASIALAMDHQMKIIVIEATVKGNLAKAVSGEKIGTIIS